MTKFTVCGLVTVSCYTVVEADTKEAAISIAEERQLADLCAFPFGDQVDEAWHVETDGSPVELRVEES